MGIYHSWHFRKWICVPYGILIALFCFGRSNAQTFKYKTSEASEIISGTDLNTHGMPDTMTVWCNDWDFILANPAHWGDSIKLKSNSTFVKFAVNNYYGITNYITPFNYTYRLTYDIFGYYDPADTIMHVTSSSDTLTISYNNSSFNSPYQDLHLKKYSNFYKVMIVITGIYEDNSGTITPANFSNRAKQNFQVEGSIVTQRFDKKEYGAGVDSLIPVSFPNVANNYLDVYWNYTAGDTSLVKLTPVNFELEWTYVDDYTVDISSGAVSNISPSSLGFDFMHNSTRVWLDSNHYRIPLVYQSGYIVYRVRAVRPDSTLFQYPIYGDWYLPDSGASIAAIPSNSYYQLTAPYLHDSLNWQYTISFAEEGKYKHVVSFYDGLLKNRQSITRFNSNPQKLIVTQNVYDYEGRPSIKTLPAPVDAPSFTYQYNVDLNSYTGLPYQAMDFDTGLSSCPTVPVIAPLATNALASIYYSNQNPDTAGCQQFVPDAGGYPLVQTIFQPGYNDRVGQQGGAGPKLQIGDSNTITNYYVGASQAELNSLFGENVGWQSFYTMTVSSDPNRQLSMSIHDYEGRQIATALIGPGPSSSDHAITSVDVPPSYYVSEDLLFNTPQEIIGNTKTAYHDFFNEAAGTDSIQYFLTYDPFNVCPGYKISVKAHYHYDVTDQCGNIVVSQDSTVGANGLSSSTTSFAGSVSTFSSGVAPYHTHKTLTIASDDLEAAFDSLLISPPPCFLTEPYFIRQAVESQVFPCPPIITDPCALKKWQMEQELFPGAKYGKYTTPDSLVTGTSNSIFTLYPGTPKYTYRYQDTCTVPSLSDTITVNGVTYTDLRSMPADSFIYVYNLAIGAGNYSIAEALLPLHPEYCVKCFDDTFKNEMLAIPSQQIAQSLGVLYLDSIVAHDPLVATMTAYSYTNPTDSLSTFHGGHIRLDSFILERAYCSCSDSVMFSQCVSDMFEEEIASRTLINDKVKSYYFNNIVSLYFQNRQRFVDAIMMRGGDSCSHCAFKRMTLIPEPVYDHMITDSGGVAMDSITLSTYSSFAGSSTLSWLGTVSAADSMDSTLTALYDSALVANHFYDSTLCHGVSDSLLGKLVNCFSGDSANMAGLRNTLDSMCAAHVVINGNFTPEQVRFAILRNGDSLSDICNPYVASYISFSPPMRPTGNCYPDTFYKFFGNFIGDTAALNAFATPGSFHFDTVVMFSDTFHFELFANYDSSRKLLELLVFTNPAYYGMPPTDTLRFFLRSPAYGNVFTNITDSFEVSMECISNYPQPITDGLINDFSFLANVNVYTDSTELTIQMLGWMDSVATEFDGSNSIANCIPCTQMRDLYTKFTDTLLAYGIVGVDHPYYDQMLQNFMNYNLHQLYSSDQYETFIESCALADSMLMPLYVGYATYAFHTRTGLDSFMTALNGIDTNYSFEDSYRDSIPSSSGSVGGIGSGGGIGIGVGLGITTLFRACIDISEVPLWELWKYKNFFNTYSGAYFVRKVNLPFSTTQPVNELGCIYTAPSYPFSPADSAITDSADGVICTQRVRGVWMTDHFEPQIYYDITNIGAAPPYIVSKDVYDISRYIYNHGIPYTTFVPNNMSTINADYFKPEKQAYLQYTYGLQQLPPYQVLDSLQANNLISSVPSYSGDQASYTQVFNPNIVTNLYLADSTVENSYVDTVATILLSVEYLNTVNPGYLFFDTNKVVVITDPDSPLIAYRCADGAYWYRYFTTGDTMFNVFVRFPDYIPQYMRKYYQIASFMPGLGIDSTIRTFTLGLQKAGDTATVYASGLTTFGIGKNITLSNVLLGLPITGTSVSPPTDTFNNCERSLLTAATNQGILNYDNYMDSIRSYYTTSFANYLLNYGFNEQLNLSYLNDEFGYTLYGYDRAGNLYYTEPPMGVIKMDSSVLHSVDTSRLYDEELYTPDYNKLNYYEYNSVNQVVDQSTINGGYTRFIYDAAGRLVFSQNAKQALSGSYTYNLFDKQNRIIETGQAELGCGHSTTAFSSIPPLCVRFYGSVTSYDPPFIYYAATIPYDTIVAYIRTYDRQDVVMTIYDTVATNLSLIAGMSPQSNLRKRVAAVKYFDSLYVVDSSLSNYTYATHYSYDIDGNVNTLVQDFPALASVKQRYKRIDYDYDLISGKVNMLSYDRGFADQYYQRYKYDADNRITEVNTSADGYIWSRDAAYTYYEHGPLARVDLGDLRVQGIDYAYTIQGWLKVVNGDTLNSSLDMGKDGFLSGPINAPDAVAYTLDYFKNDYKAITANQLQHVPGDSLSLYNGNISRQTMAIDTFRRLHKQYVYDQMNRIKNATYFSVNAADNTIAGLTDYQNNYTYDLDGNINALVRYGNNTGTGAQLMDSLSYQYISSSVDQLGILYDYAPNTYTNDLKQALPSGGFDPLVYNYDPIGNTIMDLPSAQDTIQWNLYNKVTRTVNNTDGSEMDFEYDGAGNRISKAYIRYTDTGTFERDDYYVHDAQGNILAIYHAKQVFDTTDVLKSQTFSLTEHDIYGSSRLGVKEYYPQQVGASWNYADNTLDTSRLYVWMPWYSLEYQDNIRAFSLTPYGNAFTDSAYTQHITGQKQYELTDHLGNVLATIADQRATGTYDSTGSTDSSASVLTYKSIVESANDYYPFGQLMPGRYVRDTNTQTITTTISESVTLYDTVWYSVVDTNKHIKKYWFNSSCAPCGTVWFDSSHYLIDTSFSSTGLTIYYTFADTTQVAIGFEVHNLVPGKPTDFEFVAPVYLSDSVGSCLGHHGYAGYFIGYSSSFLTYPDSFVHTTLPNHYKYSFTPVDSVYTIYINPYWEYGGCDTIGLLELDSAYTTYITIDTVLQDSIITSAVPMNVIANVSSEDHYHYGFNGQMKINEWAGVGNHTTAEYWEYDTRTGRRANIDPQFKKYPWLSPYTANFDNPIQHADRNGDDPLLAAIGFLVGGLISLGESVHDHGWEALNEGKTWAHAGTAAVAGGIIGATDGASLLVTAAVTGAGQSVADDLIDNNGDIHKVKVGKAIIHGIITAGTASFGNFLGKTIEGAAPANASKSLIGLYKALGVGNERAANGVGNLLNYGVDKAFKTAFITVPDNWQDQNYWNDSENW